VPLLPGACGLLAFLLALLFAAALGVVSAITDCP